MSFCTACGCERTGANHYCDGCGAEFGEPEPWEDHGPDLVRPYVPALPLLPAQPLLPARPHSGSWASGFSTPWSFTGASGPLPAGPATRPDVGIGLLDSLLAPPDPAGEAWPEIGGGSDDGAGHPSRGRLRWLVVATVAVVIVAGLGGAAAFELRHGHGRANLQAGGAAAHARPPRSAPSSASGPSGHGGTGAAVTATVAVASAVGHSAALPQVLAVLDRYFSAINQHDYAAYARLLDPQARQRSPASAFSAGDGSTTDSGETLTGLAEMGSGGDAGLAAAVTFTSHQQPVDSPDHSDCDAWSITLYLVPEGSGYLIGLPPAGYQGSFTSC
jgi:hypothetical protein